MYSLNIEPTDENRQRIVRELCSDSEDALLPVIAQIVQETVQLPRVVVFRIEQGKYLVFNPDDCIANITVDKIGGGG